MLPGVPACREEWEEGTGACCFSTLKRNSFYVFVPVSVNPVLYSMCIRNSLTSRVCFRRAEEARPQLQRPDPEQVSSPYNGQVVVGLLLPPQAFTPDSLCSRGCTDIVCCILFVVAILAYFAVGILGKDAAPQLGVRR